jgi:hypothetical protein
MHEGFFGPSREEIEAKRIELIRQIDDMMEEEGLTDDDLYNSIESVLRQAEENNYDGRLTIEQGRTGRIVLIFRPAPSKFHQSSFYKNFAEPLTQGMRKFQPKVY